MRRIRKTRYVLWLPPEASDGGLQIADMINLFSTQPEKRALSYDDFSNVLMRGGLV